MKTTIKYYRINLKNTQCCVNARCYRKNTKIGFKHVCESICFEIYSNKEIIDLPNINYSLPYLNRAYEEYEFQSVLLHTAKKYLDNEDYIIVKDLIL